MICHLLSELVLFSSKLSHTKVPNINSVRQSHAFLPAIVRSQKSPRYQVPSPRSCHLLLMTGGPTNSLCLDVTGFAEAPNRKTAGFTGSGGCETWWEIFFLLSDSSDIVLFHYLPFDRPVGACPSHRQSG